MPTMNREKGEAKLGHIIYASTASSDFDEVALRKVLDGARRNNAAKSISGLLLFSSGYFFQVLEGERAVLRELFAVISADGRHRNVTLIIDEPIAKRAFADWSMAYVRAESAELASIEGLEEFGEGGRTLGELGQGRARKLLSAFIDGRWRAQR